MTSRSGHRVWDCVISRQCVVYGYYLTYNGLGVI